MADPAVNANAAARELNEDAHTGAYDFLQLR